MTEQDEKVKEIINHIKYTLKNYPTPEDLEWSTEQIQALFFLLSSQEKKIRKLEGDLESFEGHHQATHNALYDYQEKNKSLSSRIKELEEGIGKIDTLTWCNVEEEYQRIPGIKKVVKKLLEK